MGSRAQRLKAAAARPDHHAHVPTRVEVVRRHVWAPSLHATAHASDRLAVGDALLVSQPVRRWVHARGRLVRHIGAEREEGESGRREQRSIRRSRHPADRCRTRIQPQRTHRAQVTLMSAPVHSPAPGVCVVTFLPRMRRCLMPPSLVGTRSLCSAASARYDCISR